MLPWWVAWQGAFRADRARALVSPKIVCVWRCPPPPPAKGQKPLPDPKFREAAHGRQMNQLYCSSACLPGGGRTKTLITLSFGTGLVCAVVQQGKTVRRESCSDDHMPVTRGYIQGLYLLLHGPIAPSQNPPPPRPSPEGAPASG